MMNVKMTEFGIGSPALVNQGGHMRNNYKRERLIAYSL